MRFFAILAIFTLVATACGGADTADDSASSGQAAQDSGGDVGLVVPPPPPPADDAVTTDAGAGGDADQNSQNSQSEESSAPPAPAGEFENIVLHVNDDVQIVQAFDAPDGAPMTVYDINAFDGRELEYPLYAQTVFGNRLALRVDEYDATGNWAKVQVPVRPNNTTVWVQTASFTEERHDFHITIDLSDNEVTVFQGDEVLLTQTSVAGRESRPTPIVRSYIDEKIPGGPLGSAYGSWILSIAAFSEALPTFGGGLPKLALHGTNQPELMGEYVSSGCVRVPNEIINFIAETVPVGTVVDIVP